MEEYNKLIAKFMGETKYKDEEAWSITRHGYLTVHGDFKTKFRASELKYHKSWDWLMPVVEKIEEIAADNSTETIKYHRFCVDMSGCFCSITDNQEDVLISESDGGTKLKSTFLAVVEFIEWYNKQPKPNPMCDVYTDSEAIPDEDGNCSLCGEKCHEKYK